MTIKYLSEFQRFLIAKKFVLEKNAPFYARWVSKFLSFSNKNEGMAIDIRIKKFLKYLVTDKTITDWQIKQAETALRLYIDHFLKGNTSKLSPNTYQKDQKNMVIYLICLIKCVKH